MNLPTNRSGGVVFVMVLLASMQITSVLGADGVVVGGVNDGNYPNTASGPNSFVGAGSRNTVTRNYGFIGAGKSNSVTGKYGFIGGGSQGIASKDYTTVGGGYGNHATGKDSTVGGGRDNRATAENAFIGGGKGNSITGNFGWIGGGRQNKATQEDSAALGENALAEHADSLVLGFNDAECKSNGVKTVSICASGGLYLNGVQISAGESTGGASTGGASTGPAFNATEWTARIVKLEDGPAFNATEWTARIVKLEDDIATLKARRDEANTLNQEESASSDLTATTSFPLMLCLPAGMFMSLLFLDK